MILLAEPAHAAGYSRQEIEFLRVVATQAAIAIHGAKLAESLVASESEASRATFATGLLHDIGKEVSWIRMIAGRLETMPPDDPRGERDVTSLRRLSRDLSLRIREFMSSNRSDGPREVPAGRAIERAIESVSRLSPDALIESTMPAQARGIMVDVSLVHVVTNLLDNAIRASESGVPIRVFVTIEQDALVVSVVDRGAGLDSVRDHDPFQLGFTTRGDEGGSGIGLAYAQDIAQSLGGSVRLTDNEPVGARAEVRLPLDRLAALSGQA
jgi:signal transduction histidine kinase